MRSKSKRSQMAFRLARFVLPGALILGTSCAYNVRKSLVAAGLDFVKGSAGDVLGTLFPVGDILAGNQ